MVRGIAARTSATLLQAVSGEDLLKIRCVQHAGLDEMTILQLSFCNFQSASARALPFDLSAKEKTGSGAPCNGDPKTAAGNITMTVYLYKRSARAHGKPPLASP
jgi:hypothetical protein